MERKAILANCVQHAERGKMEQVMKLTRAFKTKSSDFNLVVEQKHVRAKINIVIGPDVKRPSS